LVAAVRWQVSQTPLQRTPAACRPPELVLLSARDGRLRWRNPSVGAWGLTPRPWMGSARPGRRPLAHPAWKRWEARRVPGLAGHPPAWDRSDQRTRCRWRRRSDSVGCYRELSGSPLKTWPGHSGSVPPGTTGNSTHHRRWAGRGPAYRGSAALRPKGCRGRRPTQDTCATWLRYFETQRRRRLPRRRTGPRSRRVARPSPRLSQRSRGHPPRPRARARRHHRGPDRARPGGALPQGALA